MSDYTRPVAGGWISSTFTEHQKRKPPSVNPGVDFAVSKNTAVKAPASGTVAAVRGTVAGSGPAGRFVTIFHYDGRSSDLLHLNRVDVKVGERVKQGAVVGLSGASANGSESGVGPHLHWSLRNGHGILTGANNIDGLKYLVSAAPWDNVKSVQARVNVWLSHLGVEPLLVVDGKFGPKSRTAIRIVQKYFGLVEDGFVGPATWGKIKAAPPVVVIEVPPVVLPPVVEPPVVEPPIVEPEPVEPPIVEPEKPNPPQPPTVAEPSTFGWAGLIAAIVVVIGSAIYALFGGAL